MYFLARHAFACAVQDHVVILDVKSDRYCAVPPRAAHWMKRIVHGWPNVAASQVHAYWPPDTSALGNLLQRGVLTTDTREASLAVPRVIPAAVMTLAPYDDPLVDSESTPTPVPRLVVLFFASCLRAALQLRFRSLDAIVRCLERHDSASSQDSLDIARAEALVHTFRQLRPLFFGSTQRCLFSSLSLLHFLHANGVRVYWVFGVQLSPFAAHCWLQRGPVVINDRLERVRRFTPIMVA
jgi:hypothetical protein